MGGLVVGGEGDERGEVLGAAVPEDVVAEEAVDGGQEVVLADGDGGEGVVGVGLGVARVVGRVRAPVVDVDRVGVGFEVAGAP